MKPGTVNAITEASSTGFGVFSEDLPGITGYGKTILEARQDFEDAITDVLESHAEEGTTPPSHFNGGKLSISYQ